MGCCASANWKQLAGFVKYDGSPTIQDRLASWYSIVVPTGTLPSIPTDELIEFSQDQLPNEDFDFTHEKVTHVPEGAGTDDLQQSALTPSAGVSSRGPIRKMSRAMQDFVSQRSFYGNRGMHYMGNRAEAS
jgi:hypothetical protein